MKHATAKRQAEKDRLLTQKEKDRRAAFLASITPEQKAFQAELAREEAKLFKNFRKKA